MALGRRLRRIDLVAACIVASLAGMIAFGSFAWWQQTDTAAALHRLGGRQLDVSQAAWEIRWYDEVLTHSAARYVLSGGDPVWRARYDTYVERLDAALARARTGASPAALAHLDAVDTANQRLITLETRVLGLVDRGRAAAAAAILAGEYERQKAVYRAGLDSFFEVQAATFSTLIESEHDTALEQRLLTAVAATFISLVLVALGLRYHRQRRQLIIRDRERGAAAASGEFEQRLSDALGMVQAEADALETLGKVLAAELPTRPAELLLADSSRAHLHLALRTPEGELPGCAVGAPHSCPAIRRGHTLEFALGDRYDACPHLRRRETPCSAVCVPVSLDGSAVGVLHSTGPNGLPVTPRDLHILEESARRTGERIGMLRAFSRSEQQARSDGLTGLLNRRSASDALQPLLQGDGDLAVALLDLDHFKQLNDTHGHDAGDRALRLFARILREEARPDDVVARWGGEEFLVALHGATAEQARSMLERVRRLLAAAIDRGGVPSFTTSAGVVDTTFGRDLEALVALADTALYAAKEAGRNRVELVADLADAVPPAVAPASTAGMVTHTTSEAGSPSDA